MESAERIWELAFRGGQRHYLEDGRTVGINRQSFNRATEWSKIAEYLVVAIFPVSKLTNLGGWGGRPEVNAG
jgi:hypothetical protein